MYKLYISNFTGVQAVDIEEVVADTVTQLPAEIETTWSQPSASYLQTPIHDALQTKPAVNGTDISSSAVPSKQ